MTINCVGKKLIVIGSNVARVKTGTKVGSIGYIIDQAPYRYLSEANCFYGAMTLYFCRYGFETKTRFEKKLVINVIPDYRSNKDQIDDLPTIFDCFIDSFKDLTFNTKSWISALRKVNWSDSIPVVCMAPVRGKIDISKKNERDLYIYSCLANNTVSTSINKVRKLMAIETYALLDDMRKHGGPKHGHEKEASLMAAFEGLRIVQAFLRKKDQTNLISAIKNGNFNMLILINNFYDDLLTTLIKNSYETNCIINSKLIGAVNKKGMEIFNQKPL